MTRELLFFKRFGSIELKGFYLYESLQYEVQQTEGNFWESYFLSEICLFLCQKCVLQVGFYT